jgi:hypothetical protein
MDSLAKSDIFFFITTIAVVILTILASIALVYAIKFLRDLRVMGREVKRQWEIIEADIEEARHFVQKESGRVVSIAGLLGRLFKAGSRRRTKRKEGRGSSDESQE